MAVWRTRVFRLSLVEAFDACRAGSNGVALCYGRGSVRSLRARQCPRSGTEEVPASTLSRAPEGETPQATGFLRQAATLYLFTIGPYSFFNSASFGRSL